MADRLEIIDALESLAVHCRPPLMSVDDKSRWMADWASDLSGFPIEAIKTACQRWRMGTNPKFPMPGQFIPLVRSVNVGAVDKAAIPKEWAPASEAEYASMSLSDKIREHELLAIKCDREAGPMWANGEPVALEDMPERWHGLKARAANHRAEVKRLREKLRSFAA